MEGLATDRSSTGKRSAQSRGRENHPDLPTGCHSQWQSRALALTVLLLGVFGWGLKVEGERATVDPKLTADAGKQRPDCSKENTGQAVAAVELRYQKLYAPAQRFPLNSLRRERLSWPGPFAEGCTQMDNSPTNIKTEAVRERGADPSRRSSKPLDRPVHPLRGLLPAFTGFKYHERELALLVGKAVSERDRWELSASRLLTRRAPRLSLLRVERELMALKPLPPKGDQQDRPTQGTQELKPL